MQVQPKLYLVDDPWKVKDVPTNGPVVRIERNKRALLDDLFEGKDSSSTWWVEITHTESEKTIHRVAQTLDLVTIINGAKTAHLVLHNDSALQVLHVITRPQVVLDLNTIHSEFYEVEAILNDQVQGFLRCMNLA